MSRSRSGTPTGRPGCVRHQNGPLNVEYHRDIKPILERSCVACHTAKNGKNRRAIWCSTTNADLVRATSAKFPGTYYRLALDERGQVRPQAGRLRLVGLSASLALHPQVPIAPQPARLEDLRRAARRLLERRSSVRIQAGAGDLVDQGKQIEPKATASRRHRLRRQRMPPPEAVQQEKLRPDRRRPPHARPLDRPRLPDRPRLRSERPRSAASAGCSTTSGRR